jgi:hypothetical protein
LLNTVVPQIQAAQAGDSYVMVVNATTPALRITQTGTGDSILVEDAANPDSSPFVVTAGGDVGIGTSSPSAKLDVAVADAAQAQKWIATTGRLRLRPYADATAGAIFESINTAENAYLPLSLFGSTVRLGNGAQVIIDTSGNLGLGVAPSATMTTIRSMQLGYSGIIAGQQGTAEVLYLGSNWYFDGAFKYQNNGFATRYDTASGEHVWRTAPSGTAGNAISFTQAMTLANNGTLLLGTTTDFLASAGNFTLGSSKPGGETDVLVYNPSNTAASRARVWISNGGTSAGSANLLFTSGLAGTRLVMGVDSADGDKFKIGNGYYVGSATTYVLLDTSGNLLLGGTVSPASATKSFSLFNGTVPTGSVTDGCVLYTEDVSSSSELKVRDEAGNVTTLSPHNFDLIPEGPSEEMAWSYYSERDGKRINVDMLKAIRLLEKLSGEKLVHFA